MIHLDPTECRVLGVLVEKAHKSSGYPMSLNAITDGCNQKSNRNPVVNFDEDRVMAALDSLRSKQLVLFADMLGSRVTKFRHNTREVLAVGENELLILVELLLRGPQTPGELRARASRMRPLESLDAVHEALGKLMDRPEPLVQRIPGGRVERYAQLLCPKLHPLTEPAYPADDFAREPASQPAGERPVPPAGESHSPAADQSDLAIRVANLESQLHDLRQIVHRLAEGLGASDMLKP